jgi:hypothetical protein
MTKGKNPKMVLTDNEKEILEIIARFTFLSSMKDTGHLTEEKYTEIMEQFGHRNHELIQYYLETLNQHLTGTREFLDNLEKKKSRKKGGTGNGKEHRVSRQDTQGNRRSDNHPNRHLLQKLVGNNRRAPNNYSINRLVPSIPPIRNKHL